MLARKGVLGTYYKNHVWGKIFSSTVVVLSSVVLKPPWLCPQAGRGGACGVQQEHPHLRGGATTGRGPLREENLSGEDLDFYHG